jgi:hypothetical protein
LAARIAELRYCEGLGRVLGGLVGPVDGRITQPPIDGGPADLGVLGGFLDAGPRQQRLNSLSLAVLRPVRPSGWRAAAGGAGVEANSVSNEF